MSHRQAASLGRLACRQRLNTRRGKRRVTMHRPRCRNAARSASDCRVERDQDATSPVGFSVAHQTSATGATTTAMTVFYRVPSTAQDPVERLKRNLAGGTTLTRKKRARESSLALARPDTDAPHWHRRSSLSGRGDAAAAAAGAAADSATGAVSAFASLEARLRRARQWPLLSRLNEQLPSVHPISPRCLQFAMPQNGVRSSAHAAAGWSSGRESAATSPAPKCRREVSLARLR
jgi:hypothetical protein